MTGKPTPRLVGTVLASMAIEPHAALSSLRSYEALHIELCHAVRWSSSALREELSLCRSLIEVLTSMVDNGTLPVEPAWLSAIASQAGSSGGSLVRDLPLPHHPLTPKGARMDQHQVTPRSIGALPLDQLRQSLLRADEERFTWFDLLVWILFIEMGGFLGAIAVQGGFHLT